MWAREETSGLFQLTGRSVDVWAVGLSASDAVTAVFHKVLAAEEAARAVQFHFEHLRRSYIVAHGALRLLLGRYLGIAASNVRVSAGPGGKPELDMGTPIRFNLSHSGGVALFGFTLDCEIGLDLEIVRSMPDMIAIAGRFFCAGEVADLMSLAPAEREAGFFRCWTRKEAYLKAIGAGLNKPLDSFRVTLLQDIPPHFVHIQNSAAAAREWTLHDIDSISGFAAALAYQDSPRPVRVLPIVSSSELLKLLSLD